MTNKLLAAALLAAMPSFSLAQEAVTASTMPAGAAVVEIDNMQFAPAMLTVEVGTTVTWINDDTSPHTVTDKGRVFRSAALDTQDRFSYTFTNPGEFNYFCTLHPMMVGKIVVKPAGAAS